MKLVTYSTGHGARVGAVTQDGIVDLAAAATETGADPSLFASMLALIEAGEPALEQARGLLERPRDNWIVPMEAARLFAPLPVPKQIRDFTVFPIHAAQAPVGMKKLAARLAGQAVPDIAPGEMPQVYRDRPIYYISNRFSVVGPEAEVQWPGYSQYMDFELEFAAVIGAKGKNIPRAEAKNHIFGYTIFNDFSARDAQLREMAGSLGPAKGKSFDTGNVMGPYIVTCDEIPNAQALKMEARVNGQVWASGDSSAMLHSFEDMIAYVSQDETIYPGEVFGSGTMGNGCGLEQDRYLQDGDVVELEVGGLGVLRNKVTAKRPS